MDASIVIWIVLGLAFLPAVAVLLHKSPWFRVLFVLGLILGAFQLVILWLQ